MCDFSFATRDATGHLPNRGAPLNRLRSPLEIDFNVLLLRRRDAA